MQTHMAIEIFKYMKSFGVLPDSVTYNIMIDCCSILRCFRSACALVSMMIRDGFYPRALTFSALMKVYLYSATVVRFFMHSSETTILLYMQYLFVKVLILNILYS